MSRVQQVFIGLVLVMGLIVTGVRASLQTRENAREAFTAFAIDMEQGVRTGTIEIVIERWSTESERQELRTALQEDQQEGFLRALRDKEPVGFIRSTTALGYPLRYAAESPMEDGRRQIVVATDRPIGFAEAWERPRSIDYPLLVAELHIGPDGTGEGRMTTATQISLVGERILLERFALQPVRLEQVEQREVS